MEADGFQADTEEDDEEDCVILSIQSGELCRRNKKLSCLLMFTAYRLLKKLHYHDEKTIADVIVTDQLVME